MKAATLALIIKYQGELPSLIDVLSDEREIEIFESNARETRTDDEVALSAVYEHRMTQSQEDNEFGDYIEELLSQPFVRPEVQEHAVAWFKSKIRIEQYQKT